MDKETDPQSKQLRLNRIQRQVASFMIENQDEPFRVRDVIAHMEPKDRSVGAVFSVIDKLSKRQEIEGFRGRITGRDQREFKYMITGHGVELLQHALPTRTEQSLHRIKTALGRLAGKTDD